MRVVDLNQKVPAELYDNDFCEVQIAKRTIKDVLRNILYHVPDDYIDKISFDAEPVRHGEWIPQWKEEWRTAPMGYACSLCGEKVFMGLKPLNYCPYCGARIDGEK